MKANPYEEFARIRAEDPVHLVTLPGQRQGWLITRYEDADRVLRDPCFVKDASKALAPEEFARQFPWLKDREQGEDHDPGRIFGRGLLNSDPPDHTRLRSLVNIAFPLPMTVITEMLGVPSEDRSKFRQWSNVIIEASGNPREIENRLENIQAYRSYLHALIQEKRKQPADDLLSHLIETEEVGDKLTEEELIAMVSLLLIAGHETTVNLISNGTLALLQHPDQREKL